MRTARPLVGQRKGAHRPPVFPGEAGGGRDVRDPGRTPLPSQRDPPTQKSISFLCSLEAGLREGAEATRGGDWERLSPQGSSPGTPSSGGSNRLPGGVAPRGGRPAAGSFRTPTLPSPRSPGGASRNQASCLGLPRPAPGGGPRSRALGGSPRIAGPPVSETQLENFSSCGDCFRLLSRRLRL